MGVRQLTRFEAYPEGMQIPSLIRRVAQAYAGDGLPKLAHGD